MGSIINVGVAIIPTFIIEHEKADPIKNLLHTGAEDEIRTRDPRLGKAMLYH